MVKAVAGTSDKVMRLLFDRREAGAPITEGVIKAASGNRESGREVVMLLLDRGGADVLITEEVVKAAAGNELSGHQLVSLFPEH